MFLMLMSSVCSLLSDERLASIKPDSLQIAFLQFLKVQAFGRPSPAEATSELALGAAHVTRHPHAYPPSSLCPRCIIAATWEAATHRRHTRYLTAFPSFPGGA